MDRTNVWITEFDPSGAGTTKDGDKDLKLMFKLQRATEVQDFLKFNEFV